MLKINNLTKYYGKVLGVKNLSLELEKGEIFGFIGPNGAGKSTTIRCIMNLINKTSGEIIINNALDTKENNELKQIIGYLPSEIHLYDDLTVKEMIEYSDSFYKKDCLKKANELVKKLNIDTKKRIDDLSLGNLKKIGIVLALMHSPKLLILDEATSGLDPLMQEVFYEILEEEKEKGTTIFFSTHNLNEIKRICDRVGIIKEGNLIKIETIEAITNNSLVSVSIKSKDTDKIKRELKIELLTETGYNINFIYKSDINKLLTILNKYKIDKLLINDLSIEEIFMHYYK